MWVSRCLLKGDGQREGLGMCVCSHVWWSSAGEGGGVGALATRVLGWGQVLAFSWEVAEGVIPGL